MSGLNMLGISWPPKGWEQLGFITKLNAQVVVKDPMKATIIGVHYKIEPIPVYNKEKNRSYVFHISIDGWQYSILNESREYNILSFDLIERHDSTLTKDYFLSNIKTKSRPLLLSERSAHRIYMAALFMLKKIENGQVPDFNKILRLYKIHPSQRNLYEISYTREDSRNCGLATYCVEKTDEKLR